LRQRIAAPWVFGAWGLAERVRQASAVAVPSFRGLWTPIGIYPWLRNAHPLTYVAQLGENIHNFRPRRLQIP
jgi:hypothetical protein